MPGQAMFLLIDVSGVLFLMDEPPRNLDWEAVEEANELLGARLDRGEESFDAWLAVYNGKVDESLTPQQFFDRIFTGVQFNKRLADYLARLDGCTVAILSDNYAENVAYFEEHYPFSRIADKRFYSFSFGCCKDDPALFLRVLERLGAEPKDCLLVDDNMKNLVVADNLGMQTYHFTDTEETIAYLDGLCGDRA